jgi:hypothetical protein
MNWMTRELIRDILTPLREYNGKRTQIIGRIRGEIAQNMYGKGLKVEDVMEILGLGQTQAYEYRKRADMI